MALIQHTELTVGYPTDTDDSRVDSLHRVACRVEPTHRVDCRVDPSHRVDSMDDPTHTELIVELIQCTELTVKAF